MIDNHISTNHEEKEESQNLGRGLPFHAEDSTEDEELFFKLLQQMQEDHPEDE
ncbi:hypothetical protein [Enterococcus casseliflavus]|uniref:hypothetical protein n=1 Tax=Enterococcus casseliflavus TaxID=37734 RepID=UPI001587BFC3|nr:hypothetical protein [Enterococcus casseliflavus]